MNYAGWITIGSKMDTKELEKQLNQEKRRLEQYEKEAEKLTTLKAKVEIDLQDFEAKKAEIQKQTEEDLKVALTDEQAGWVLDEERMQLEKLNQEYAKQFQQISEIDNKLKQNAISQSEVKNQVSQTVKELEKIGHKNFLSNSFKSMQSSLNGIETATKRIGTSLRHTVTSAVRWGVAIFGIRTAYMFLRQAMSTLSQYDEQLATNVEYLRYLLASALKPVIETVVNLAYKLLMYVGYIFKALFGINIFANASAKAFQKQQSALGGSVKKAKELQKTLAGFDEMNILQENGDVTPGGGGGGVSMPKMPKFEDVEIPEKLRDFVDWIVKNKDKIIDALLGIALALTALKMGISPLKSLGLGVTLYGILQLIKDIRAYLKDPSWDNFLNIIKDIAIIAGGIGMIIGGIPGLITAAIAAGVLFAVEYIKHWDEIKKAAEDTISVLESRSEKIHKKFGDLIGSGYDSIVNFFKMIIKNNDISITTLKKNYESFKNFIKKLFAGDISGAFSEMSKAFKRNLDYMLTVAKNIFKQIWNNLTSTAKEMGYKTGEAVAGAFKGVVNGFLGTIEKILKTPIEAINKFAGAINSLPGVNIKKLSVPKLPRLAKGGIVNIPGRGVPIGGAIAGENGKEGVIPLTDSQQMELLGEAIGKYITVNANITNTMNGRVISRELKKIQNESNFAFNR